MTVHDETEQLYVYGIVPGKVQLPQQLSGVGNGPVEVSTSGALAALVTGLAPDDEVGTPDNLLAHSTVLDTMATRMPILPMTFGTIVPSEAELHDTVLAAHEDDYLDALDRLEGTVQYTVRARYIRDAVLADLVEDDPDIAQLRETIAGTTEDETRDERIQLGELIVGAFDQMRPEHAQQIIDAVAPTVVDYSEHEGGQVEDVIELAVLVAQEKVADFDAALESVAAEVHTRIHVQLLGPQAPYDFVGENSLEE